MTPSVSIAQPPADSSVSSLTFDAIPESADKIFGMENFGNTCYCNSVLQCLYYLKPFREQVLAFARNEHNRKRPGTIPGVKPHPFVVDPSSASISTSSNSTDAANTSSTATSLGAALASAQAQQEARSRAQTSAQHEVTSSSSESTKKSNLSLGRRLSRFGSKKEDKSKASAPTNDTNASNPNSYPSQLNGTAENAYEEDRHTTTDPNGSAAYPNNSGLPTHHEDDQVPHSLLFDSNNPVSYSDYKRLYPALRGLTLGMRVPTQNSPVVGYTDDPFATPELRKRSALSKGPIINLDHSYSKEYGMHESMFSSLKDIFDCMAHSNSQIGVVSPSFLIEVLKRTNELFRSSMHQDAHEFLNYIINDVFESVDNHARSNQGESSWIHELFEGLLTSETKCLTCETISRRDEQFLDLSIDIERNTSVTSCLRQFSASEMLCERNKFNCDNCGGFHEAQKRMKIKKLPKLLALHLKRFKFTEDMQRNVKLFHEVVYPRYLRLFNTTDDAEDPEKLYELQSVIVHIGGGPYHGHYVSVVKTENAGWLLFDDEMVESVDPNYVFSFFGNGRNLATAYVLFYQEISQEKFEHDNLCANLNLLRQPCNQLNSEPRNAPLHTHGTYQVSGFHGPYGVQSTVPPTPITDSTVSTLATHPEVNETHTEASPSAPTASVTPSNGSLLSSSTNNTKVDQPLNSHPSTAPASNAALINNGNNAPNVLKRGGAPSSPVNGVSNGGLPANRQTNSLQQQPKPMTLSSPLQKQTSSTDNNNTNDNSNNTNICNTTNNNMTNNVPNSPTLSLHSVSEPEAYHGTNESLSPLSNNNSSSLLAQPEAGTANSLNTSASPSANPSVNASTSSIARIPSHLHSSVHRQPSNTGSFASSQVSGMGRSVSHSTLPDTSSSSVGNGNNDYHQQSSLTASTSHKYGLGLSRFKSSTTSKRSASRETSSPQSDENSSSGVGVNGQAQQNEKTSEKTKRKYRLSFGFKKH